ncbi:hypothetical protein P9112_003671 [Eukaryota sp. TZLM1-RC]
MSVSPWRELLSSSSRLSELRKAIETGKVPSTIDPEKRSLQHIAAKEGKLAVLELLLESNHDPNAVDSEGATPLHLAALYNHPHCITMLLRHGADPHASDIHGDCAIHYAAIGNAVDALKVLIQDGGNGPNDLSRSETKFAPLHFSAQTDSIDAGLFLIRFGAEVNGPRECSETPLHVAARRGYKEFVMLLLGSNADPNARDSVQKTPLMEAARYGNDEVCKILIGCGARTEVRDGLRRNALRHARIAGNSTTESLLSSAILKQEEWSHEFKAMLILRDARMLMTGSVPALTDSIESEALEVKKLAEQLSRQGITLLERKKEKAPKITPGRARSRLYREVRDIEPEESAGISRTSVDREVIESDWED